MMRARSMRSVVACAVAVVLAAGCAQRNKDPGRVVQLDETPAELRDFLSKYYSRSTITEIREKYFDKQRLNRYYEVYLVRPTGEPEMVRYNTLERGVG